MVSLAFVQKFQNVEKVVQKIEKSIIEWAYFLFIVFIFVVAFGGCDIDRPTVKPVASVNEIQGKWKIVELTDPNGNGFEPDTPKEMVIEGTSATSDGESLRLEFAADNSYVRLFAKVNGIEKNVGEIIVELTTEAVPNQMIWMDRAKPKQVSLFQKE